MNQGEGTRSCPRCVGDVSLIKNQEAALVLDHCFECHGVWLDQDEWKPIVGRFRSVQRPKSIPLGFEAPDCPACKAAGMESPGLVPRGLVDIAEVEIDVCRTCGGAWLDGGELKQLREQVTVLRREERERDRSAAEEARSAPRRSAGVALTSPEQSLTFVEALCASWEQLWD